jgi:Family of unknown function (DUF6247)
VELRAGLEVATLLVDNGRGQAGTSIGNGGDIFEVVTTATATAVKRTGPGIAAALRQHAPREAVRFESELREALARAATDLDVARVEAVMARWHTRACILANALTDDERELVRRAQAGDFSGLRARDENGGWTTL